MRPGPVEEYHYCDLWNVKCGSGISIRIVVSVLDLWKDYHNQVLRYVIYELCSCAAFWFPCRWLVPQVSLQTLLVLHKLQLPEPEQGGNQIKQIHLYLDLYLKQY